MKLFTKLSIKNIRLNKKRSAVTVIGIILSVILITTTISIYSSLISSITNFIINKNGNFHVAYYGVNKDDIKNFKNDKYIEEIDLIENIGYSKINSRNENKPYLLVKSLSKNSINNLSIKLKEGRLPKNNKEILIPEHLETNAGLQLNVGDKLTLNIGSRFLNEKKLNEFDEFNVNEELINTSEYEYKIVGIMEKPSLYIEDSISPSYTLITHSDEMLSSEIDLYIRYSKNGERKLYEITSNYLGIQSDTLKKVFKGQYTDDEYISLASKMNKAKYTISINDKLVMIETNPLEDNDIKSITNVIIIIGVIIILTSIFCIKNSFDISMFDKIKNYGILSSIGATKQQIKKYAIRESFILGIIAIPIGIVLGILSSIVLLKVGNYYFSNDLENNITLIYNFNFISIIISIIISLLTIYLSSIKSAKKVSKIPPITVIKRNDTIQNKSIKNNKLIKKVFGISGIIAYKNIKRNNKKYKIIIISLVIAITTFIVFVSSFNLIYKSIQMIYNTDEYNIHYSIDVSNNELLYRKVLSTTNLSNIKEYSIVRSMGAEIIDTTNSNNYVNINTLGKDEYKKYIQDLGIEYEYIKDKAILIDYNKDCLYDENKGKNICENKREFSFVQGDKIILNTDNKENLNLTVGYVSKQKPFSLKKDVNSMIILSDEIYDDLIKDKSNLSLYFNSSDPDKLQSDINEILNNYNYNLNNVNDQVKSMKNFYKLISVFLYTFIIVIILIDLTSVFNTISTDIETRKQELAIFKSIGMTSKEFNKMIGLESIFIGTKTCLYSIPIGLVVSFVIFNILNHNDIGLQFKLPFLPIILSLVFISLFIYIIMKYAINKLKNQNIIETIRNENI